MAFQFFSYVFLLFSFHSHIVHAHLSDNSSPSLMFLNQLRHVKNGDSAKGVRELKNHLAYLGYLNKKRQFNDQYEKHQNTFDDSLEIALKNYQKFYHLNTTGILDDNTITKMRQPQCGLPNFFNPNNSLPFHVISHYSFLPGSPKWHTMNLTYSFDQNVTKQAKSALKLSLREWESATPFKFHLVRNFHEANIKISFMTGHHGDKHPFGPSSKCLAHSSGPLKGEIHFNNHKMWSWTGKRDCYDIQTVGLHELGHVLGLGHSSVLKAIMYPTITRGLIKGLDKDDIDGINHLYSLRRNKY